MYVCMCVCVCLYICMYLYICKYLSLFIETDSKSKRYTIQRYKRSSYKVVMYIQKLHHYCNTSSPDDDPELGRKYWGNN